MDIEHVKTFCGDYPDNFINQEIASDPNFVFPNDPNFDQTMLWDSEGNWVYVNSFVECEHYVVGGWFYYPPKTFFESIDLNIISQLLIGILIFIFTSKLIRNLKFKNAN